MTTIVTDISLNCINCLKDLVTPMNNDNSDAFIVVTFGGLAKEIQRVLLLLFYFFGFLE